MLRTFYPHVLEGKKAPIVTSQANAPAAHLGVTSYKQAVHKAMPSVVSIFTYSKPKANPHQPFMDDPLFKHFFGDQQESGRDEPPESSLGSGVIVNKNGLILTNNHVISAADKIEVALGDGRKMSAKVVGADPETDLAVIKIKADDLPAITFANAEKLSVGDVVLAIGNPFDVGQTVTQGIVSGLNRNHLGINTFENFIQTDASINPGNSGGALIDTSGDLVGINSAIYSRSGGSLGIGFAIPATLANHVMQQIAQHGSVTRGWIGIEAQDITPELAESFKLRSEDGALVASVLRDSPADMAGVKVGDILVAINGKPVLDSGGMLNLISVLQPHQKATLKVLREGKLISINVIVGRRPKPSTAFAPLLP